jgi:hypothetical protein
VTTGGDAGAPSRVLVRLRTQFVARWEPRALPGPSLSVLSRKAEVQVSKQGDLSPVVSLFVEQNPHDLAGGQRLPEMTGP